MPNLPSLTIGKHTSRLPIVQGGMGVGISGSRLAGAVAREGGVGTLSGIGMPMTPAFRDRYFVSDPQSLYDESGRCVAEEVRTAKGLANGGPVFLNAMAAIRGYTEQVRAAMEAGVDGIVTGAGFPPDSLLELAKDFPSVSLIPILSAARGVQAVVRKWERQGRLPDAIILEDPSKAGGHLGANKGSLELVDAQETRLSTSVPETLKFLASKNYKIPVIAAGGIVDRADVDSALALGASGVQLGTRFLASHESGAHAKFKAAIVAAKSPEDLIVYQSSACLPARALRSSAVFSRIEGVLADPKAFLGIGKANDSNCRKSVNCLQACALRDGYGKETTGTPFAQMCIADELINVVEGGTGQGLYFTGTSALRIDTVKSVRQIMAELSGETA